MGAKHLKTQLHFNEAMPLCNTHWLGELTPLSKPITTQFPLPTSFGQVELPDYQKPISNDK